MSAAISAESITKVYRSGRNAVRAIEDVSLRVSAGELVLLMGPSGSGKSTLLSVIGCILRPTSGRVLLNGRDVTALADRDLARVRLREIGFVFQDASLFPSLNAAENVEMPLELLGIRGREARRRSAALLAGVGLAPKAAEYPRNLSGGEKQRVAIARSMAAGAGILLADEPTAALDLAAGRAVFGHLRRLATEEGRAVVVVSHDHRMEDFATRTVHLEDGRLLEQFVGGPA
ncbi:MAG TPA: ABC transporter ATP-binding protein [Candidatus Sulfopaludibacter sp.]|nr:ABC transporter ATP-binding protein [Candidatus Sulfopaludibacter sp.]